MKQSIKHISGLVSNIYSKSPVRLTFFILIAIIIVFYCADKPEELTSYSSLVYLLSKVLALIISLIILFSFITCLFAYLSHVRKNKKLEVQFEYSNENSTVVHVQNTSAAPLAGWTKIVFNFRKFSTKAYTLVKNGKDDYNSFEINFPKIQHYNLNSVTIYFNDIFGLFSFQKKQDVNILVPTFPEHSTIEDLELNPNQQRQETKKSNVVHRQEGELLNFKDFEPSDDIRRIVWQIYAKSKELVVRSVEMQNMYVSEITVLPLFSNIINDYPASGDINNFFIDIYKNKLWGIAQGLHKKNDVELRLLTDQLINIEPIQGVSNFANGLACLEWRDKSERKSRASIYCVSSLTDIEDIEELEISTNSYFIFITITKELDKYNILDIAAAIFIKPSAKFGITDWLKSPFRTKIKSNEKAIRAFLDEKHKFVEL